MFEKLVDKLERMLYIEVEQKFARTKERVPRDVQSRLWDIPLDMIQAASKEKRRRQIMLRVRTYCASWALILVGVSVMLHVLGVA